MTFLSTRDPRSLTIDAPNGFEPVGLFLGSGAMALEVVVLKAGRQPSNRELRQLHAARLGRRATPVVVIALWGNARAAICGPKGDDIAAVGEADRNQIERLCDAALGAPDRHAALRLLSHALDQLDAPIPDRK